MSVENLYIAHVAIPSLSHNLVLIVTNVTCARAHFLMQITLIFYTCCITHSNDIHIMCQCWYILTFCNFHWFMVFSIIGKRIVHEAPDLL